MKTCRQVHLPGPAARVWPWRLLVEREQELAAIEDSLLQGR